MAYVSFYYKKDENFINNNLITDKCTYEDIFGYDCDVDSWYDDDSDGALILCTKSAKGILPTEEEFLAVQNGVFSDKLIANV